MLNCARLSQPSSGTLISTFHEKCTPENSITGSDFVLTQALLLFRKIDTILDPCHNTPQRNQFLEKHARWISLYQTIIWKQEYQEFCLESLTTEPWTRILSNLLTILASCTAGSVIAQRSHDELIVFSEPLKPI